MVLTLAWIAQLQVRSHEYAHLHLLYEHILYRNHEHPEVPGHRLLEESVLVFPYHVPSQQRKQREYCEYDDPAYDGKAMEQPHHVKQTRALSRQWQRDEFPLKD